MLKKSNAYRKEAITAAKDLGYSKEIIDRIKQAKSHNEITRILTEAREGK